MIWESGPWKSALLADADVLERWANKPNATIRRSLLIERKIFVAAYAMRKLWEVQKLSTSFRDRSFHCATYPAVSDRITRLNYNMADKLYALDNKEYRHIGARDLIDLIIHSFAFIECLRDDKTVEGFLVTSDRKRYERLWHVELGDFTRLMRQVGSDYPSSVTMVFYNGKNDWELWAGHGDPPARSARREEDSQLAGASIPKRVIPYTS